MADGWAFKPPIDDAKWAYLEEHVFPLAEKVWGDAGRFKQLQEIATKRKGELERKCRTIVAAVANDAAGDGDGKWFNFNDSCVEPDATLDKEAAYILFYRQRPPLP